MNYLRELNAFYDWLDANPCPSHAVALWHTLMAVCNRAGWPEEFTVANSTLQAKAGLSRKQLNDTRGLLISMGRIIYKPSKRVNKSGRYSIVRFGTQEGTQEGTPQEHRTVHEKDPLVLKLNKTKLKERERSRARAEINQTPLARLADEYQRGIGPMTQMVQEELAALLDEYPEDWITAAFKECAVQNVRKLSYAKKILANRQKGDSANGANRGRDVADVSWTQAEERFFK